MIVVDMQNDFCAPGGYIDRRFGCDAAANEAANGPASRISAAGSACDLWVFEVDEAAELACAGQTWSQRSQETD